MRVECRGLGRRGVTAAVIAVSLAALLGMVALAVDVGMLMKVRGDAQRAADAAALAGAKDFLNPSIPNQKDAALKHALEYASRNYVGWKYVDTSAAIIMDSGAVYVGNSPEAYVQVIPAEQKVRVFIRREQTPNWFGKMFRLPFTAISVKAAAQAVDAGTGKCVKPFAIPDMWQDNDDDINPANRIDDIVGQQGKKGGEEWEFDQGDVYQRFKDPSYPNTPTTWTGWGSSWRNQSAAAANPGVYYYDDYGRQMVIKMSNPQESPSPGFFYPWTMPYDASNPQAYCDAQGSCASPNNGAQWYKWNISHCNPVAVNTSETVNQDADYLDKPGNMIGPTNQGMDALIAEDPLACWAEFPDANPEHIGSFTGGEVRKRASANGACDQPYPGWENSARVAMVPLFDPSQITSGRTTLTFNNLALIFIEGQDNAHAEVTARFLYYAKSTGPLAPTTGSLIKKLQLVE
jgi:hypothetical protein